MANENSLLGDVARYLTETYAPIDEEEDEGSEEVVEIEAEAEVEDVDSDEHEDADDQIKSGDEHDVEDDEHDSDVEEGATVDEEAEAGHDLEDTEGEEEDDDEDKTLVDVSEDEDEDEDEYEWESESEGDILDTFLNIFKTFSRTPHLVSLNSDKPTWAESISPWPTPFDSSTHSGNRILKSYSSLDSLNWNRRNSRELSQGSTRTLLPLSEFGSHLLVLRGRRDYVWQ